MIFKQRVIFIHYNLERFNFSNKKSMEEFCIFIDLYVKTKK